MSAHAERHIDGASARPRVAGLVLACLLLALAGCGAFASAAAYAGTWTLASCRQPDGSPAPTEGWSTAAAGSPGAYSGDSDTCKEGGALSAFDSGAGVQSPYSGPEWVFTAPAGSTITGGTVTASLTSPGGQAWLATPTAAYESADVFANCQYNQPCGASGTLTGTFAITHTGGSHLYAVAVCVGTYEGATKCPEGGGTDAAVSVSAAEIELANSATPATSEVAGTLISSSSARGTEELTLNATDREGPGVYRLDVLAGGKTLYEGTPDTNGGRCVPVGEGAGGLLFDHIQPCRQQESIALPIDTIALPDGSHTLKVTITDAAGNSAVVYDQAITTDNAPEDSIAPAITTGGQAQVGTTLSSQPGAWSAPEGAGSITYAYRWQSCKGSGEGCQPIAGAESASYTPSPADVGHTLRVTVTAADSDGHTAISSAPSAVVAAPSGSLGAQPGPGTSTPELLSPPPGGKPAAGLKGGSASSTGSTTRAVLHLGTRNRITRSFKHRALHLRGRLLDSRHHPIAHARLAVLQQIGDGRWQMIGHANSGGKGRFVAHIPPGPSRKIEIAYKDAGRHGYAAAAKVHEKVRAGVRLHVHPRHTGRTGTIVLTGRVLGRVPSHGVLVALLVHYRGKWVPFRDPHTNRHGRFKVAYRFQGAVGRFPFRAQVPGGQAHFPFATGKSEVIHVRTS